MFPGETVLSGAKHPGTPLAVLQSAGGFYIGFLTDDGFPYSRETEYFATRADAEAALHQLNDALDDPSALHTADLPFVRGALD
jgi:hypothetical protein